MKFYIRVYGCNIVNDNLSLDYLGNYEQNKDQKERIINCNERLKRIEQFRERASREESLFEE